METEGFIVEYPADTAQPADHGPSYYLTLRPRSFAEAVRDVSKRRDLPDWVWPLLREMRELRPSAEIVSLADVRRGRK